MAELPTGTVTFLFTDIEGSTQLWEDHADGMRTALARHDDIVRTAIETHRGHVVKMTGDGFHAVFASAYDAIDAAVAAQLAIDGEAWPDAVELKVRMGVHTGEAELRDGDYYGSSTNRAARLMSVGHGRQVVVSGTTQAIVGADLPSGVELVALGEHRLRDLAEPVAVFQLAAAGLTSEFPALRSLDAYAGNLPAQLSSFVGRERDVAEIAGLLRDSRLVTLTGVGGVGKTRLALQVAGEVVPRFADGAWLVELAKVRDPDAVAEAIAVALGAPNRPDTPVIDTLASFLRVKRLLLVLDNCEHVLDAASTLVRTLEQSCPHLVVLATSREGLGVGGERLVAVRSLREAEAEQLFVGRASAAKVDFVLSGANASAVQEICRRLDGIPLAIELAAARVVALSPAQIASRLDQRFQLLAGGERGAIERHATLRAAIDWSFELLAADEQLMLARLSVFAGACTLEAAEAVCADESIPVGAVLDLVSSLVARSLVIADATDADETSYRLLETIRQYAEERLDADDRVATRDRHARHYLDWLRGARQELQGPRQVEWIGRADRETENVRAAIGWALAKRDERVAFALLTVVDDPPLALLPAGRAVWDATDRILELVRGAGVEHVARAVALAAWWASIQGDYERAEALCEEARARDDGSDDWVTIDVIAAEQQLALTRGDEARAMQANSSAVAWARSHHTDFNLAGLLSGLASQHANGGDFETARTLATEALDVAHRTGAPSTITMASAALAFALVEADPDAARGHLQALVSPSSFPPWVDEPTLSIMMVAGARLGAREPTLRAASRMLAMAPPSPLFLGVVLETSAAVLAADQPRHAAALRGAVDAVVPGFADLVGLRADGDGSSEPAIDRDDERRAREEGARMSEDEATVFVAALVDEALAGG